MYAAITYAVQGVFWWAVPAALVVFVLAWMIKEVPLRGRTAQEEKPAAEMVG